MYGMAAGLLGGTALGDLFGGGPDFSGAQGYLGQIPGILQKYFAPYGQMVHDPTGLLAGFGAKFRPSPGFQYTLGEALKGISQAAAAGGMAGSPEQQTQAATTASGLASQDYNNFINQILRLYMGGATGYSQLGENLARALETQAQLSALQSEEEEKQQQQGLGAFGGAIGAIASKIPW